MMCIWLSWLSSWSKDSIFPWLLREKWLLSMWV
jgi:hypothetical protein